MSKKIVLCFILSIISFLLCIFSINVYNNLKTTEVESPSTLTLAQFENLCMEQNKNDDYSFTYINKSDSISAVYSKLELNNNNISHLSSNGALKLSNETIDEICDNNDLHYYIEGDSYLVRNIYGLKRLIVEGELNNYHNAENVITGYKDYSILSFNTIEETKSAYNELSKDENLLVSPDIVVRASYNETITQATTEYEYLSWGKDAINLDNYNKYIESNSTNKDIVVAVLDTGINTSHEMFLTKKGNRFLYDSNNKIVGYSYTGTTYTYSGYKFEDDDWYYSDGKRISPTGHGTHVSGTIVDLTPENVKILPIKVLNYTGSGSASNILNAVNKVIDDYAPIYQIAAVNMSLGGTANGSNISNFTNAFAELRSLNILPIVAAGNETRDTQLCFPAGCDNAIVVTAGYRTYTSYEFDVSYSNFGDEVDICAPGSLINSATIGSSKTEASTNKYVELSGTSMATPHVSAVVALLCLDKSLYDGNNKPTYSATTIEDRLLNNCTIPKSEKTKYGKGLLTLANLEFNFFEVTSSDCTATYDGNYHNINVNVTNSSNYTISYSLDGSNYNITSITNNDKFKNATNGEMPVYFRITGAGFSDYCGQNTLKITPKDITVSISNQTFTYGNINFNNKQYSVSGLLNGDNLGLTLKTNAISTSPAGEYSISINNYTNKNYTITNDTITAKLTINKKTITITIPDQNFTYGNINFNNKQYIATGLIAGDNLGLTLKANATFSSSAGEYTISVDNYTNSNYTITNISTTAKLIINQKPVTITIPNQEFTFGDVSFNNKGYSVSGLVSGDNLGLTLSTNATNTSTAGDYTIYVNDYTNKNYTITNKNLTANLFITRKNIHATLQDIQTTYKEPANVNNVLIYNTSSIVSGFPLNAVIKSTASTNSNVGDYELFIESYNNNYNLICENSVHKIIAKQVESTILPQTFDYGDLHFNNTAFTYNTSDIYTNDNLNATLSTIANNSSNVGTYNINLSFDNPNYVPSISVLENGLTINQKEIEITLTTTSFMYGEPLDDELFTQDDTTKNLDIHLKLENEEVVAITSNVNYKVTITNSDEEIEIIPRPVKIKVQQTFVYGEQIVLDNTNFIGENVLEEDKNSLLTLHSTANSKTSVGNHKITYTLNNENYEIESFEGTVSIVPRDLNVTIKNKVITYGDKFNYTSDDYTIKKSDLIDGDNVTLSLNSKGKSAGSYKINAICDSPNYNLIVNNTGILTINKRKITVKLNEQSIYHSFPIKFDNTDYTVTSGEVLEGDDLNINITANATLFKQFGEFDLFATYDNSNYDITFESAKATVTISTLEIVIISIGGVLLVGLAILIPILKKRRRY